MLKQAIILRKDLKMGKGKAIAQALHAALGALKMVPKKVAEEWERAGAKKIVLKVSSEEELLKLYEKAKEEKLPCYLVRDAGLTQLPPGTPTAIAIGPAEEKKVDRVTKGLKLY